MKLINISNFTFYKFYESEAGNALCNLPFGATDVTLYGLMYGVLQDPRNQVIQEVHREGVINETRE